MWHNVPATVLTVILALAGAAAACKRTEEGPGRTGHIPAPKIVSPRAEPTPDPPPARPRWVLFGGGADPASSPISIAHDLDSMAHALEGTGLVLFGAGPGSPLAVERAQQEQPDDIRSVLAALFGGPGLAQLDYQPAALEVHGPATRERVLATLRLALAGRDGALSFYFAGHGEQGEVPSDNRMLLWGGTELTARELAELLDEYPSEAATRLVSTACFGGGFAEIMFAGARAPEPPEGGTRCGVFAAPWDDEASGCDPSPDRRDHESYALHLVQALMVEGRAADLDGDGELGLLDAHTHARRVAQSFDVPTTTSERFLRLHAPTDTPTTLELAEARKLLIEDAHVVDTLGAQLGLLDETSAFQRVLALETRMQRVDAELAEAEADADEAYFDLRIALLERWPLLDHPFRKEWDTLIEQAGPAILRLARDSELALEYERRRAAAAPIAARYDDLRVKRARALRVSRAFESLRLAAGMLAAADPHLRGLRRLLRCERAPL